MVGNPIMHHLVLGLDPTELGRAPFALALDAAYEARARELGLDVAPGAFVYALPCIAGHVGADTAGVVLAEGPHLKDELTFLVDVGTNAEIVFGNRERLFGLSPTGPAFEGAQQISCGQRAAPGAIERVRIDRATLEPRFKVIGCDLWSNEPGFDAATATLGVTGVCGSGIIEVIAERFGGIVASTVRSPANWRRRPRGSKRLAAPSPMCCTTAAQGFIYQHSSTCALLSRQGRALCRGEAAHGARRGRA